jgi:tetratricopeptide (TPR) repeat protein
MDTELRATFVVDAATTVTGRRAAAAGSAMPPLVRARTVAAEALIGRDLRECDRIVVWGWRTLAAPTHLRELLVQCRARIVAVVPDAAAAAHDAAALSLLRRHAAHVVVDDDAAAAALRGALLAPVHLARSDAALTAVLRLAPGAPDSVDAHLVEARLWNARGELAPAFAAASRALRLAPDQPGIVADVARLLANLGDAERAAMLCERFLRQRPDAAPVREVLRLLREHAPA